MTRDHSASVYLHTSCLTLAFLLRTKNLVCGSHQFTLPLYSKIFPMILAFLQHCFLPARTLPSISTLFHSCHLLPNIILQASFCTYLLLLLISPPGDIRCTLLSSNSKFCSLSEMRKMVLMSVKREIFFIFVFTFASLQNLRAKFGTLLLYHLIALLNKEELPCSFACS